MDKIYRRSGIVANVCMILFTLIGSTILIRWSFGSVSNKTRVTDPITKSEFKLVGNKFGLTDVDWSVSDNTIILALSNQCGFCYQSLPFYRQLAERAKLTNNVRLLAGFPQTEEEGRKYLTDGQVEIPVVRQLNLPDLGIRSFPTLVLINKKGVVQKVWIGKLNETGEKEVLRQLGL